MVDFGSSHCKFVTLAGVLLSLVHLENEMFASLASLVYSHSHLGQ
jgi:hypothetical protein